MFIFFAGAYNNCTFLPRPSTFARALPSFLLSSFYPLPAQMQFSSQALKKGEMMGGVFLVQLSFAGAFEVKMCRYPPSCRRPKAFPPLPLPED